MDEDTRHEVTRTLHRINWNYRNGDISRVDYDAGKALVVRQYGSRWYTFTFDGTRVRFRGVTRTIGFKLRYRRA
jgi:hypothetical protein